MSWVKATIVKSLSGSFDGTYWEVMKAPVIYVDQTGSEEIFAYSASYSNESEEEVAWADVYRWAETEGREKLKQLEQSDNSGRKYSYKITRY